MRCASFLNESPKERELLGAVSKHPLWVPVDGEKKARRPLNPFDDPVWSDRVDRKVGRQVADDLVVGTGDVQLSNAQNLSEARAFHNRHRVGRLPAPLARALVGRVGIVPVREVLI
jgi:hypothetical protein